MKNLTINKRPPNDKFLLFHPDNLFLIQLTYDWKKLRRLGSPPIGSPRYTKGLCLILQFGTTNAYVNHKSGIFTSINMHLLKLAFNP